MRAQVMGSRGIRWGAALGLVAALAVSGGARAVSPAHQAAQGSVLMAELFPMTGQISFVGSALLHGATVGQYEVNHNGGIMGMKLGAELQDDAGDTVDAVPAWHALELHSPAFEVGPTVFTAASVIRLYDPTHLVDFLVAGATAYDHMQYPYVFRVTVSDSTMAKGMAAYAMHKHLNRAALIFTNGANSQTIATPLIKAYEAHGGHVVANVSIVPQQSSYRTEIEQVFAQHPDAIFWQSDPQTAGTLFHDMEQLGMLNVPIIGTDNGASSTIAQAMGMSYATKYLTGMAGAAPNGPAWSHFVQDYTSVYKTKQPLDLSDNMYDAVIISALAMTAAHSTNPTVWVHKIITVSNPPGTACYTYASCVALLKAGKKINFEGSSGPEDFDQYHNVYGGWEVVQFDQAQNLHTLYSESASMIGSY
ncbi:MAG TPA: ABC transporter substrate-binding protein [Chloroflexota bacterium]|nr:ABC transporter substrate-binding protein [Chloroflexota bacterium]